MRLKYKRSLMFLGILIILCAGIGVAYLFYDHILDDGIKVVVDNELSINYLNGNKIKANGEYNFSVTNNGENDVYYNIQFNNIKSPDKKVTYSLKSEESNVNIQNRELNDEENTVLNSVLIKAGATENFKLIVMNNTITSFIIEVKKTEEIEEYFYMTILKDNQVRNNAITKVGEDISEIDEGLIENVDDYGMTYYFRGAVKNNYVSFAGATWRIIRINGDGTVRLILNNLTDNLSSYHEKTENYEDYAGTTIASSLNTYYEERLREYDSFITSSKFCVEKENVSNENETIYNAYTRVAINKIPTLNCLGDSESSKIGLITVDEVIYAGGMLDKDNKNYYLYNEEIENYWWTSNLAKAKTTDFYPFALNSSGKIIQGISGTLNRGLRPVINLDKKVKVSGKGTTDNPYVIKMSE